MNAGLPAAPAPLSPSREAASGHALAGLFISGLLMSFLGAVLPAWGFHLRDDLYTAGNLFLALNAGILAGVALATRKLRRRSVRFTLAMGNVAACASLLLLSYASTPLASTAWRYAGVGGLGLAAGMLNTAIFRAISPLYKRDAAATVNLAGAIFGLGCVTTALLVAGTYYVYTVPSILILFAAIPGLLAIHYSRVEFAPVEEREERPLGTVLDELKNPAAILFSLLLFFQFGNEWTLAGWLPVLLIRHVGLSPATSVVFLAVYWAALLTGRVAAQLLLRTMSHGRLLLGSLTSALFGCVLLGFTPSRVGAAVAVVLIGCGFAAIYPLVVEKIGNRFPHYHPGLYNGIFSFAVTGGLIAPWLVGFVATVLGIGAVMIFPLLGTFAVLLLVLAIMLHARFA